MLPGSVGCLIQSTHFPEELLCVPSICPALRVIKALTHSLILTLTHLLYILQEEALALQAEVIRESLKGHPEEEILRMIAQYNDDMHEVKGQLEDQQRKDRDKLLAKLAARKRMKQELDKEKAIAAELNRITEEQVSDDLTRTCIMRLLTLITWLLMQIVIPPPPSNITSSSIKYLFLILSTF